MATERLAMHVLREILRQKLGLGRSHRQVAAAVGVSAGKVASVYADARSLGIDAAAVEAMTDAELAARLYPKTAPSCARPEPDCAALHLELRRRAVTLALLHVEYLAEQPQGLRYTAFCDRYREWLKRQSPVMRQTHVAGDKLFVDYSGMKARLVDPVTGEVTEVELFVAMLARILGWAETLGPSTRAFCEAILRERRHPEWGYRSCLGLFRLAKKYGDARVEAASRRALFAGARSYRHVLTILQHNLDQQPLPTPDEPASAGAAHENVRGRDYYH
jgi:transposase